MVGRNRRLAPLAVTVALLTTGPAVSGPGHAAAVPEAPAAAQVFNVKTFGAKGDGSSNDSGAVNRAITAANSAGGGIVEFPSGTYKSANTVHLKSNVTLQLDSSSTVVGANARGYDKAESNPNDKFQDFGHSHFHDAMFFGDGLSNVGFTGSGTIDGGGDLVPGTPASGQADKIISLTRCDGLTLSGITLKRGGHFAALINGCDNVVSDHLTIATSGDRDGWNIISTSDVTITNITDAANDDALVFKSDWALGKTINSAHVTVTHAHLSAKCCNALMFGSETCGNFSDYQFNDITVTGAGKSGLGMVSMDGANISDVHYKNVTMSGVHSPIMEKVGDRRRCGGSPGVGRISNVTYDNVSGTSVNSPNYSATLWGNSSSNDISNVTFTGVGLTVPGGSGAVSTAVPGNSSTDYNPNSISTRPAYGWYLHNASNISFTKSSVKFSSTDARPAVIANAGSAIDFSGFTAQSGGGGPADLIFQNVSGFCVSGTNSSGGPLRVTSSGSSTAC